MLALSALPGIAESDGESYVNTSLFVPARIVTVPILLDNIIMVAFCILFDHSSIILDDIIVSNLQQRHSSMLQRDTMAS